MVDVLADYLSLLTDHPKQDGLAANTKMFLTGSGESLNIMFLRGLRCQVSAMK
jgi:hypothetical protein